jgi:hypothetical protein
VGRGATDTGLSTPSPAREAPTEATISATKGLPALALNRSICAAPAPLADRAERRLCRPRGYADLAVRSPAAQGVSGW